MISQVSFENQKIRFLQLRKEIKNRDDHHSLLCKNISFLEPIIFKAKFCSLAQSVFAAFKDGNKESCLRSIDRLSDFSQHNYTFVISSEQYQGDLQYVPSLLVSMAICPPCIDVLVSVLRCISSLTSFTYSTRFTQEEFLHYLLSKIREKFFTDPSSNQKTVKITHIVHNDMQNDQNCLVTTKNIEIQKFCLIIIYNLIKKCNINLETLACDGMFDILLQISDGNNKIEVMKIFQVCLSENYQDFEFPDELIEQILYVFMKHTNSESPDEKIAAFDGLTSLLHHSPETTNFILENGAINSAFQEINSQNDSLSIAALSFLISIIYTENFQAISFISSLFDWSNFCETWNFASNDKKRVLCEFINTIIAADPKNIELCISNQVFEIFLEIFGQNNFSLEKEVYLTLITATEINPNKMIPLLLDNGLINLTNDMIQTTENENIFAGMKMIDILIHFESNQQIQSKIKEEIDASDIYSTLEVLSSNEELSEDANSLILSLMEYFEE